MSLRAAALSSHSLQNSEEERERDGGREKGSVRVCVCAFASLCVAKFLCCLLLHPQRLPTTAGKNKDLLQRCEWDEPGKEKKRQRVSKERGRWVCSKVREPRRIVILQLPDDSLFCCFLFLNHCCENQTRNIKNTITLSPIIVTPLRYERVSL